MQHDRNLNPPRHGRLFELLRQKNQAETTVARVQDFAIQRTSVDELMQLQQAATRSLQAQA